MLPLKNNERTFGWPAQLMHWIMAIVIIGMIVMGLKMVTLPNNPDKLWVYGLHKATGVLIFFFVLFRYLWRQFNYQPEVPRENGRGINYPPMLYKAMNFFAHYWHVAIYLLVFLMPISGWLMTCSFGFPVSVFGWFVMPCSVQPNKANADLFKTIHDWTSYVLIFFITVHILASLFHHYILKDIVMKRMLPAIAILLIATPAMAVQKFEIDKAKSSIKFEATQNGAPAVGEFKTYDAQINFDPNDLPGSKVKVSIDMGSVSSTYNEMVSTLKTADWFDVQKFPTANFESIEFAEATDNVFGMKGNLQIRDKTFPQVIQFHIDKYDGKTMTVTGNVTLKRSQYEVGQGEWKDTSAVKDDVKVELNLVANATK